MLPSDERAISPSKERRSRDWGNILSVGTLQSAESDHVAIDGSLRDVKLLQLLAHRLFVSGVDDNCMDFW